VKSRGLEVRPGRAAIVQASRTAGRHRAGRRADQAPVLRAFHHSDFASWPEHFALVGALDALGLS
jgi:hypothetical protein